MIYDIHLFVKWEGGNVAKRRIEYLRQETKKAGFPGVHLQAVFSLYNETWRSVDLGIDSMTLYNWGNMTSRRVDSTTEPELSYRQWGEMSMTMFDSVKSDVAKIGAVFFPNLTCGWDTNARFPKGERQNIVHGANPKDFEDFARRAREWVDTKVPADMPKLITVNSWNEWTEGTYLEPDDRFGYGYLEALRKLFVQEN